MSLLPYAVLMASSAATATSFLTSETMPRSRSLPCSWSTLARPIVLASSHHLDRSVSRMMRGPPLFDFAPATGVEAATSAARSTATKNELRRIAIPPASGRAIYALPIVHGIRRSRRLNGQSGAVEARSPLRTTAIDDDPQRERRGLILRRVVLGVIAIFVALGAVGVFGVKSKTVTSSPAADYQLSVRYPSRTRAGLPAGITIRA